MDKERERGREEKRSGESKHMRRSTSTHLWDTGAEAKTTPFPKERQRRSSCSTERAFFMADEHTRWEDASRASLPQRRRTHRPKYTYPTRVVNTPPSPLPLSRFQARQQLII